MATVDFGHDDSAERMNALDDQRTTRRDALPARCPHCRKSTEFRIGQYTWNSQHFYAEADDWGSSDYSYEGDVTISAECAECDADVTDYLLRRGALEFSHDHQIPRQSHRRTTKAERVEQPALRGTDDELRAAIAKTTYLLGRLLDEQVRRR